MHDSSFVTFVIRVNSGKVLHNDRIGSKLPRCEVLGP